MARKEKELKKLNDWLFQSAKDGDLLSVQRAIKCGADVNATDKFGKIPLHRAVQNGFTEIAKLLIESGADVDHPDKYRQTALHLSTKYRHKETSKMLLEKGAYLMIQEELNKQLLDYSMHGDIEEVRRLIEKGADVNYRDYWNEWSPISLAKHNVDDAKRRLQELVELRNLLEKHGAIDERGAA